MLKINFHNLLIPQSNNFNKFGLKNRFNKIHLKLMKIYC